MFTARYAQSPYTTQKRFVFKMCIFHYWDSEEGCSYSKTTVLPCLPPELHGQSTVTHISLFFVTCLGLNHVFVAFWTRYPLHVTPKYFINTRLRLVTKLRMSGAAPYPLSSRRGQRQLYLSLFSVLSADYQRSLLFAGVHCYFVRSVLSPTSFPGKWRWQILPKVGFLYQTRRRRIPELNFYSNSPSYRSTDGSEAVELR